MDAAFEFSRGAIPYTVGAMLCEDRLVAMVASGGPLHDVLSASCHVVEEGWADSHCGIYLIDRRGPKLRMLAAPTLPHGVNEAICGLTLSSDAQTRVIAIDSEAAWLWQASALRFVALAHGLLSCWCAPIYSRAGQLLGTFAVFQRTAAAPTLRQRDLVAKVTHITSIAIERARGEAERRRSEAFLIEAQRLSSTGSFSWGLASGEVTWSEEMYRIFEVDRSVSASLDLFLSRVHPDDMPRVLGMIGLAQRDGSGHDYECRILLPNGSVKYLHVVAHGTWSVDGEMEFIGAVRDITDYRLSQQALDKARAALAHISRVTSLGALTASIAHEINQPLCGIMTNAAVCLRMLTADPPNMAGALDTVRRTIRDGGRAAETIKCLRALFAKKEASAEAVDLNEATREVIALTIDELQRNHVVLRTHLADGLPPVTGNRTQLQQVILNLLLNASDAMSSVEGRSRELLVRTDEHEGELVRLSVQDAGIGLGAQVMDKLCESFYTTKSQGMGIGLFVCRFIVETHRGHLWAAQNEGPGATFSFCIPRALGEFAWSP
jgi:signal transduction histidine kinase